MVAGILVSHHKPWMRKFCTFIPRGNKYRIWFLPADEHKVSYNDQYMILLYVCFWLKTPFKSRNCWLVNIDFAVNSTRTRVWTKLIQQCNFCIRQWSQPFVLRNTRQCFVLLLGATLKSEITNEECKDVKHTTLNRLWESHLFIVWELRQVGRLLLVLTPQ